ncbi:MAG: diguanylate cyclase [Lachnospiraceae bacterium]|nr:diguanylate cyclase [Lachnospiraceae bacterium]
MNSPINIDEILIVNWAGVFCLLFLIGARRSSNKSGKRVGEYLFNSMIGVSIIALFLELLSFYIDGMPGRVIYVVQYISNALLLPATTLMGYLWCLFVEFKIFHNMKRIHKLAWILVVPVVAAYLLALSDCLFQTGFLFTISKDNEYARGTMGGFSYAILAFYYLYSIVVVYVAKHKGSQVHFFPVYTYVLPCIMGTIVQGLHYGVAAGWFAVAIALLLIEMQLQKEESFVDELSGLYNRKYLEFFYKQMQIKKYPQIFGIMMDINLFKKINDTYGHTVGDDAIRTVGRLLSDWVEVSDTVIRFAGDEFIIICTNRTEQEVVELIATIKKNLVEYNRMERKPYELSFAMGYTQYSAGCNINLDGFLRDMDQKMYEDKDMFRRKFETVDN